MLIGTDANGKSQMQTADLGRMEGSRAGLEGRQTVDGGVQSGAPLSYRTSTTMTQHSRASFGQFHFQFHV